MQLAAACDCDVIRGTKRKGSTLALRTWLGRLKGIRPNSGIPLVCPLPHCPFLLVCKGRQSLALCAVQLCTTELDGNMQLVDEQHDTRKDNGISLYNLHLLAMTLWDPISIDNVTCIPAHPWVPTHGCKVLGDACGSVACWRQTFDRCIWYLLTKLSPECLEDRKLCAFSSINSSILQTRAHLEPLYCKIHDQTKRT